MSTLEQESSQMCFGSSLKGLGRPMKWQLENCQVGICRSKEKLDICFSCVNFMSCWGWGRSKVWLEPFCSVTFQKKDYICLCSPKKEKSDQQQRSSECEWESNDLMLLVTIVDTGWGPLMWRQCRRMMSWKRPFIMGLRITTAKILSTNST